MEKNFISADGLNSKLKMVPDSKLKIVPDKRPQEVELYERYKHWLSQDEIPEEIITMYNEELEALKLK